MNFTIMVVDMIIRFRLTALSFTSAHPITWQLEVISIGDVADILESLGFIDAETAERLAKASTTVVPLPGLNTIPLTDMAAIVELVSPLPEPPSAEAMDAYILVVHGETTEENLAAVGFSAKADGPLQ